MPAALRTGGSVWRAGAVALLVLGLHTPARPTPPTGLAAAAGSAAPTSAGTAQALATLFDAARTPGRAAALDLKPFAALERVPPPGEAAALWPLQAFLLAEAHGARGDGERARAIHRAIVEWAATDPYRDGSGGSALAALSLWRLLAVAGADAAADAALFDLASRYWPRRGTLAQALFEASPTVGALPQLREDLLRRMAVLAWTQGARSPAHRLLAEYLAIARDDALDPALQRIFDGAVAEGAIDRHAVLLELGKRLERLGHADRARRLFVEASAAPDPDIAADARLQLGLALRRADGRPCATPQFLAEIEAILATARDAELRQRALLSRARRHLQAACPVDTEAFERDLGRLRREFPQARATFDAVMVAAEYHLDLHLALHLGGGDAAVLDQALARYAQARQLAGAAGAGSEGFMRTPSSRTLDLVGRAWFKPALWLHARGRPADQREALALLDDLLARWPAGPLRLAAGFWRARLLAEAGSQALAKSQFEAVIADSPYDYHALRARMRLQLGDKARLGTVLDEVSSEAIARAHSLGLRQAPPAWAGDAGPALLRLRASLASDMYRRALASTQTLRAERLPGRPIDEVPLEELEQAGRWVDVALALSLRRDAAAAATDRSAPAGHRLAVAELLTGWPAADPAHGPGGDWTLAVVLAGGAAQQHEPRYLSIAFPRAFTAPIVREAARASLPPELLYAVIRTETVFDPAAQSSRTALGLFQFMPATFRMLNQRWKLVPEPGTGAMESFLLTPETNIALGARWFGEDLLPREAGHTLFALMSHNAGPGNVRRWKAMWARAGRVDDSEFIVDTVPFDETRGFARRALTAWWIAGATGVARAASAPAR